MPISLRACLVVTFLGVLAHGAEVTSTASAQQAAAPDAKNLVLQRSDVPPGFPRTEARYTSNARLARRNKIPLSKVESWGRISGYTVSYERPVSDLAVPSTRGPIAIISTVSVHRAPGGAHAAFLWGSSAFLRQGSGSLKKTSIDAQLGDESGVFTGTVTQGKFLFRLFIVEWRENRSLAVATTLGVDGKLKVQGVLALARRQQIYLRKVR